jgi:hypothetical protein
VTLPVGKGALYIAVAADVASDARSAGKPAAEAPEAPTDRSVPHCVGDLVVENLLDGTRRVLRVEHLGDVSGSFEIPAQAAFCWLGTSGCENGGAWTPPFSLSPGDHCRLLRHRDGPAAVTATVVLDQATVCCTLRRAASLPWRVENRSSVAVAIPGRLLLPGTWEAVEPEATKPPTVSARIGSDEQAYDLSAPRGPLSEIGRVFAAMRTQAGCRVLSFSDVRDPFITRQSQSAWRVSADLRLDGFHNSLRVGNKELLAFTWDAVQVRKHADRSKIELSLHHYQVDDLSPDEFPVVLCPQNSGYYSVLGGHKAAVPWIRA